MPVSNDEIQHRPGIFLPEDTVIEKELNKRLKNQFDDKRDISKILEQSLVIAILLAHQNNKVSRDFIQKILPKIKEEVEVQASNRASELVLALKLGGALISGIASAYGAYGAVNAINTHGLEKAITAMKPMEFEQQVVNGISQMLSGGADYYKDYRQAPMDIRQYAIEEMKRHRDLNQQSGQSAEAKEAEQMRNLQQIMQSAHQISSQILGQSS